MNLTKIENLEAITLISIIMANKIILNIPKTIILSTGTSAWINVIFISIIATLLAWIITSLFNKFPCSDILDVSQYLGKNLLKNIVGILHLVFLLIIISLTIRNFSENLKIIYFSKSPIIFIIFFFVVLACFANRYNLKVISKVTLILAPIVFLSLIIIMCSISPDFVIERLFPILGYGTKETFLTGVTNLFSFSGLSYLLFLKPFLKKEQDFKKISIISIIISGIYLLISIISLLLSFSFILESNENLSIYLLSRMARYGGFIENANAIYIFLWILSVFSYISISLFFIIYISKKLTNLKYTNPINYCFGSIIFGLSLVLQNYAQYIAFLGNIFKYSILIYLFVINVLILIFANIKLKINEKQKDINTSLAN